jgi:Na+:H+ antiporter, NhaA family
MVTVARREVWSARCCHDQEDDLPARIPTRIFRQLTELSRAERAPGFALAVATIVALVWANAATSSYHDIASAARGVVNDGLMSSFFLLVGLEIRREFVAGELGSVHRAAPPLLAAAGGMLVPGLIFVAVVGSGLGGGGWGIPLATDIAFALGAMALVDADLSVRARTFLLTLAVADDVLAVVVLAVFYGNPIDALPFAAGLIALATIVVAHRFERGSIVLTVLAGAAAWFAFAHSGIEPALVGFPVGLLMPTRTLGPRRLERMLTPWIVLVVLPVFAVVNVGVPFDLSSITAGAAGRVFLGVLLARVIGKPLGIGLVVWTMRAARHDPRVDLGHLLSAGALAAAGLTVPLLFVDVALPEGPVADAARAALLVGSVGAIGLGWAIHTLATLQRRYGDAASGSKSTSA